MENSKNVANLNDAISVLVQGVQIGQKAGVYSFEDSTMIGSALEFLKSESEKNAQPPASEMTVVDVTEEAAK